MFHKASEAVEAQWICASTAFDASTAEQQPLILFFFEKYGADLVRAAQRRINSYKAGQADYTTDLQYDAKMNVVFLHCVLI